MNALQLILDRQPSLDVLHELRGRDVQRIAKPEDGAQAGTAPAEFNQRNVVAVNISPQGKRGLTPLALRAPASESLSECLIWFQLPAQ